ncbi:TPA: ead/Ea22-like family protein [Escherichia coli]
MSKIDYQALRGAAEAIKIVATPQKLLAFRMKVTPQVVLALLDELEYYKSREERVTKLVMDNSTSWDALYKKLEAAEKRIAELESGSQAQKLVEAIIVAIENEQERLFDEDYLMDSKECIDVIREEVKRWNDSRAAGIKEESE